MNINDAQRRVFENKINHGFNTTNPEQEFLLLYGEVAEAYRGFLMGDKENLADELADVAIYLFGLSAMFGIDLEKQINTKMNINESRVYGRLDNGTQIKLKHVYDDKGCQIGKVIGAVQKVNGSYDTSILLPEVPADNIDIYNGSDSDNVVNVLFSSNDGEYCITALTENQLTQQVKYQEEEK